MLEYNKIILEKVSFDSHLLKKEFLKALRFLQNKEKRMLSGWAKKKFPQLQEC